MVCIAALLLPLLGALLAPAAAQSDYVGFRPVAEVMPAHTSSTTGVSTVVAAGEGFVVGIISPASSTANNRKLSVVVPNEAGTWTPPELVHMAAPLGVPVRASMYAYAPAYTEQMQNVVAYGDRFAVTYGKSAAVAVRLARNLFVWEHVDLGSLATDLTEAQRTSTRGLAITERHLVVRFVGNLNDMTYFAFFARDAATNAWSYVNYVDAPSCGASNAGSRTYNSGPIQNHLDGEWFVVPPQKECADTTFYRRDAATGQYALHSASAIVPPLLPNVFTNARHVALCGSTIVVGRTSSNIASPYTSANVSGSFRVHRYDAGTDSWPSTPDVEIFSSHINPGGNGVPPMTSSPVCSEGGDWFMGASDAALTMWGRSSFGVQGVPASFGGYTQVMEIDNEWVPTASSPCDQAAKSVSVASFYAVSRPRPVTVVHSAVTNCATFYVWEPLQKPY